MALVQLQRKGYRAFYKTPKLVVNFQIPEGECLYDNCGDEIGRRIQFSWEIKARATCFGVMRTVQRISASAIDYSVNESVVEFAVDAIGPLPTIANSSKSKTYFGSLPQNGIATRTVLSASTLSDECNDVHGADNDETFERFVYTPECVYKPAFQYSVSHAADSSLTGAQLTANLTAMGGNFISTIFNVECNAIDTAIATAWNVLTTAPITLALGAYE